MNHKYATTLSLLSAISSSPGSRPLTCRLTTLSADQANKLLDVTRTERDRFEALYVLALTTGLRIGELLGLKWSDIDLDARRLRVSRQLQRGEEGLIFTELKAASRRTV